MSGRSKSCEFAYRCGVGRLGFEAHSGESSAAPIIQQRGERQMAKKQLKHTDVVQLSELLKRVFTKTDELGRDAGVWRWQEGWSDQRVAAECGISGCTSEHSKRLRQALLGDPPRQSKGIDARLKEVEAVVRDLQQRLARMEMQITDLLMKAEGQRRQTTISLPAERRVGNASRA